MVPDRPLVMRGVFLAFYGIVGVFEGNQFLVSQNALSSSLRKSSQTK